jgi:hypothetical protein
MSQYLTFTDVIKRIDKILGEVDRWNLKKR